jgi:peptidoglycan hydrolase-like protein with peptidoglycan-binding domain
MNPLTKFQERKTGNKKLESAMTVPPTIAEGAQGPTVSWAQYLLVPSDLNHLDIDGIFGAGTKASVEKFQAGKKLTVDGIVGPATWTALGGERPEPPTLTNGSTGATVEKLQEVLNAGRGKFAPTSNPVLKTDGIYGPDTVTAVKGTQHQGGIANDGVVGLQTWALPVQQGSQTLAGLCGVTRS